MSASFIDTRGSAASARTAVDCGEEPRDWQAMFERLAGGANRFPGVPFKFFVAGSTLLGLFATMGVFALIANAIRPDASIYLLAALISPPAFLIGAAAGQAGGNAFLRLWCGMDDASRRGFATRLTLGRVPGSWSDVLRRWLFTGDWMSSPTYDPRLPYVRIFMLGGAPATCREEDGLWREIHGQISGDGLREAGANHREISYLRELPDWARQIEKGDGVKELKRRIGSKTAVDWVMHLWRRACRQWPALLAEEYPLEARRECFEAHSLLLAGGREALVVVLRPAALAAEVAGNRREGNELAA